MSSASSITSLDRRRSSWQATLIALPWLVPVDVGPSVVVVPWLSSLACLFIVLRGWTTVRGSHPIGRAVDQHAHALATGMMISGACGALIGWLQYLGLSDAWPDWMVSHAPRGTIFGNLRQPNQFAMQMLLGMVALGWLGHRGRESGTWRAVSTLVLAAMTLACAVSGSRTGLVLMLILGLAAVLRVPGFTTIWTRGQALALLGLFALGVAWAEWRADALVHSAGAGATTWHKLVGGVPGCSSRLTLWSNVVDLIAMRPWWGWGVGELDYAHFQTPFANRFCDILDHAHNLPLHLAVEMGVPFALLVSGGIVAWIVRVRPWAETLPHRQLACTVLFVIGAHSMVEHPLWHGPFTMVAVLCLLVLKDAAHGTVGPGAASRLVGRAALALGLAGLGYLAYDYHRASQLYLSVMDRHPAYRMNTLDQARKTWVFNDMVDFAWLTTTELEPANASRVHLVAMRLLHYSPEPRVVIAAIESARLLGLRDEVMRLEARFADAFPRAWRRWREAPAPQEQPGQSGVAR